MIYLLCYGISVSFAWLANRCRNRVAVVVWSVLSIAVTVVLAGLRDYSIGIDVENYKNFNIYWVQASRSTSVADYLHFYMQHDSEYLFALYMGILAQYTRSYRLFLFLNHLIIVSGVYIGAWRQRKYVNPAMVMLLFYLLFYHHSLNIMRQYMAMAIIFAALADVQQKKYLRYVIVVAIATFIHTSAIIALAPMMVYILLKPNVLTRASKKKKTTLIFLMLVGFAVVVPLCEILMRLGFMGGSLEYYLNGEEKGFPIIVTAFLIVEFIGIYVFRKQFRLRTPHADFYLMCSIAYIVLQQLGGFINYGKRIAAYFSFINLLTIAALGGCVKKNDNKVVVNGAIIALALLYWWYMYVLRNASETYPYLLGI